MKTEEKLFTEEEALVVRYQQMMLDDGVQRENHKVELESLIIKYRELLDQTKFLTRISDRLERRLESKNSELLATLDQLTRVRIGKKARTVVYLTATFLFVFEEFFIEPVLMMFGGVMIAGVLVKLVIALLLKPAEGVLENRLLTRIKNQA